MKPSPAVAAARARVAESDALIARLNAELDDALDARLSPLATLHDTDTQEATR